MPRSQGHFQCQVPSAKCQVSYILLVYPWFFRCKGLENWSRTKKSSFFGHITLTELDGWLCYAGPSDQQWLRPVAMFSGDRWLRPSVCWHLPRPARTSSSRLPARWSWLLDLRTGSAALERFERTAGSGRGSDPTLFQRRLDRVDSPAFRIVGLLLLRSHWAGARCDQFDAWIVTRLLAAFGPTDGI